MRGAWFLAMTLGVHTAWSDGSWWSPVIAAGAGPHPAGFHPEDDWPAHPAMLARGGIGYRFAMSGASLFGIPELIAGALAADVRLRGVATGISWRHLRAGDLLAEDRLLGGVALQLGPVRMGGALGGDRIAIARGVPAANAVRAAAGLGWTVRPWLDLGGTLSARQITDMEAIWRADAGVAVRDPSDGWVSRITFHLRPDGYGGWSAGQAWTLARGHLRLLAGVRTDPGELSAGVEFRLGGLRAGGALAGEPQTGTHRVVGLSWQTGSGATDSGVRGAQRAP